MSRPNSTRHWKLREEKSHRRETWQQKSILTTLSNVEKNFAINRFDRGSQRAEDWLDDFEKECNRFEITSDEMKIRALRYFVKDASEDWYKTCMFQLSLEDSAPWKTSFLSVFSDRGWSRIDYALNFKYVGGFYTEYAIKNATARRNWTWHDYRINLIMHGLPSELRKQIDRKDIENVDSLMNSQYLSRLRKVTGNQKKRKRSLERRSQLDRAQVKLWE